MGATWGDKGITAALLGVLTTTIGIWGKCARGKCAREFRCKEGRLLQQLESST